MDNIEKEILTQCIDDLNKIGVIGIYKSISDALDKRNISDEDKKAILQILSAHLLHEIINNTLPVKERLYFIVNTA